MTSINPLSSAAASALIYELQTLPDGFGDSPIGSVVSSDTDTPGVSGKRLAKALARLRTRTFPLVMQALSSSQIEVVRRVRGSVAGDPLATRDISTLQAVNAAVMGPSAENMATGLLQVGDLEVIVAANELTSPLTTRDAVRIDGIDYGVVGIQGYPQVPAPVAYRYMLKKAA